MGSALSISRKISVHPSLILWLSILLYLQPRISVAFLLAASVHELGHWAALTWLGTPPTHLTLHFTGASMEIPPLGYSQAVLAYAAGPLASLLLGLFWRILPATALFSLCLGLFNLLPICGLDGSGILENLLCCRLTQSAAQTAVRILSAVLCAAIVPAAIWFAQVHALGLWLPMLALMLLAKSLNMVVSAR